MSRLVVLVPAIIWFIWLDTAEPANAQPIGMAIFLGGLVLTVATVLYLALRASRNPGGSRTKASAGHRLLQRMAVPLLLAWFAVGLVLLGWGQAVLAMTEWPHLPPLRTPGLALGTLPVYAAWALLLAAEYPAFRLRAQSRALVDVDLGRPAYLPPPPLRFWALSLRQRLLFALVPLLLLLAVRDLTMLGLWGARVRLPVQIEAWLFVCGALAVIVISPELIRRLLPTRPLSLGPLRNRLEALCTRTRLPMRDILVWDTGGSMVNAAVVGFFPGMRYVLLTDILLDSMTPVQIEAVFAHEVGHIRHRHLLWYFIFLAGMTLFLAGPAEAVLQALAPALGTAAISSTQMEYAFAIGSLLLVFGLFGLLSRCFERQADVFAARLLQTQVDEATAASPGETLAAAPTGVVGMAGADIFSSSLRQAARLNQLPVEVTRRGRGPVALFNRVAEQMAHFLHGTIRSRIDYLEHLARRPRQTYRFDLTVIGVKLCVIALTAGSASFLMFN